MNQHKYIALSLHIFILLKFCVSEDTLVETQWMVALLEGKKIGYIKTTRTVDSVTGVVKSNLLMETEMKRTIDVSVKSMNELTVYETVEGKPLNFEQIYISGQIVRKTSGEFTDENKLMIKEENKLVTPKSDSEYIVTTKEIDWPDSALLLEGERLYLTKRELKEGDIIEYTSFSFEVFTPQRVKKTVMGKKAVTLRDTIDTLNEVNTQILLNNASIDYTSYVTDEFTIKKVVMPFGKLNMELYECTEEVALAYNEPIVLTERFSIKSPKHIPNIQNTKGCFYKIVKPANVTIPSSDEQDVKKIKGDTVLAHVKKLKIKRGLSFPDTASNTEIRKCMMPTKYIESKDQRIISLANDAVSRTRDTKRAIKRIIKFVNRYIKIKSFNVGYASALEITKLREGDCTEHAVLTAALCRAVGIPARVVAGIVYMPTTDEFYHHAWTHVYAGGKWYSVDSILLEFSPAYIAIAYDVNDQAFFSVAKMMGTLEIVDMKGYY